MISLFSSIFFSTVILLPFRKKPAGEKKERKHGALLLAKIYIHICLLAIKKKTKNEKEQRFFSSFFHSFILYKLTWYAKIFFSTLLFILISFGSFGGFSLFLIYYMYLTLEKRSIFLLFFSEISSFLFFCYRWNLIKNSASHWANKNNTLWQ